MNEKALPKISIITACLNSQKTIETAIKSVISQNYSNLEYIIVDGGSTDGTKAIIQNYEKSIYKWVSEADKGISDAFNKGIQMANGEIIGIVSSDDYLQPGSLDSIARAYLEDPTFDVIYGNALILETNNDKKYIIKPDTNFDKIWHRQPIKHASTFVTREAYKKFGLFDVNIKYAMDYELILRFYLKSAKFQYLNCTLVAFWTGGINAQNPYNTIEEVRKTSITYGYPPIKAYYFFLLKYIRIFVKRKCLKYKSLKNIYRHFSSRFAQTDI